METITLVLHCIQLDVSLSSSHFFNHFLRYYRGGGKGGGGGVREMDVEEGRCEVEKVRTTQPTLIKILTEHWIGA